MTKPTTTAAANPSSSRKKTSATKKPATKESDTTSKSTPQKAIKKSSSQPAAAAETKSVPVAAKTEKPVEAPALNAVDDKNATKNVKPKKDTSVKPVSANSTTVTAVPQAIKDIEIPDKQTAMKLFDQLDENASGKLSLAELDKGVVTLFPEYNHKPALMAAYKACDSSGNGFVERKEFGYFLRYLVYYNNLWSVFMAIDEDGDRRISKEEFHAAADKLELSSKEATVVFEEIDVNGGGMILFDELIHYMATNNNKSTWGTDDLEELQDKLEANNETPLVTTEKDAPPPPPPPEPVPSIIMQISIPDKEAGMKLFDQLDENASGKLSLAELDKGVVNLFPEWNNKPAIMAAYKAADRSGNGFVERKEFGYFLRYIVYYNNLWSLFSAMDEDGDRRISKAEFVAAADKLDLPRNAEVVFEEIDENGGGMILFDEFVHWMATWGSD